MSSSSSTSKRSRPDTGKEEGVESPEKKHKTGNETWDAPQRLYERGVFSEDDDEKEFIVKVRIHDKFQVRTEDDDMMFPIRNEEQKHATVLFGIRSQLEYWLNVPEEPEWPESSVEEIIAAVTTIFKFCHGFPIKQKEITILLLDILKKWGGRAYDRVTSQIRAPSSWCNWADAFESDAVAVFVEEAAQINPPLQREEVQEMMNECIQHDKWAFSRPWLLMMLPLLWKYRD